MYLNGVISHCEEALASRATFDGLMIMVGRHRGFEFVSTEVVV